MITNFDDFTYAAVRTESIVDSLNVNKRLLNDAISLAIHSAELLDLLKKQAFYGKRVKLDEKLADLASQIGGVALDIRGHAMANNDGLLADNKIVDVDTRLAHGIIGKFTECGELMNVLKDNLAGKPVDKINLMEELADDKWYDAVICDSQDIDFYESLTRVIDKLKARYPEKFDAHLAENRNLEKERNILEGNNV
jgi:NTP pyrophosphatase (non-canonical NTP hydrolase)